MEDIVWPVLFPQKNSHPEPVAHMHPKPLSEGPHLREQRSKGLWRSKPISLMSTPKIKVRINEEMCAEELNVATDNED